jgi:hypothetical protein
MAFITISSTNISGWQGNSSNVQLRIYTNAGFTSISGNSYPATVTTNPASLGTFYQTYNCTANGTVLTVPAVSLDSTTDSVNNPSATFSAVFFDLGSGKEIQAFGEFVLYPTPTSTTWGNIFALGADEF